MTKSGWLRPFLAGLALRLAYPWYGHGFHHMDEHWQVIEPANSLIHGAWSKTWEWVQGDRSWIYPWLVSLPMRAAEAIGLHDPIWIVSFTRSVHGLFAALAVPLVYMSVDKLASNGGSAAGAKIWPRLAAWMAALWPYAIFCATRTQGDMAAAPLVLAGVVAPVLVADQAVAMVLSGAAFGMALTLKIDVAVAGVGFGLWQLAAAKEKKSDLGRLKRAAFLAAGVAPFVFVVGLVDRLTWGAWFHSVTAHANSNLLKGVGNQWGTSPWFTHLLYFLDLAGAPLLIAVLALPLIWRSLPAKLRAGWVTAAVFVGTYMTVPHKEKRFLAPLVLLAIVLAFATLGRATARIRFKKQTSDALALAIAVALFGHGLANSVTYLIRRPWWDRISAMREAGRIPGIQKMFSPEWPAIFYLPRNLPAESIDADRATLKAKTSGLNDIGVALDWKDLSLFTELGFQCRGFTTGEQRPSGEPQAYHCVRSR